jgi:hypothetical protein
MFDGIANQAIARPDDQSEHQHAEPSPSPAFPEHEQSRDEHRHQEEALRMIAACEGHDHVKEGVAQRLVDETEQRDVQSVEPVHGDSLAVKCRKKTYLRGRRHALPFMI